LQQSSRRSTQLAGGDVNTYRGLHAAYYDVIYANKPYAEEARFVANLIAEEGTAGPWRLLDLACGTGRHALAFAEMGHTVTGVDYSGDLLDIARASPASRDLDVRFVEQDIRSLELDGGPFDAITWLFDSVGYLVTNDAIIEALDRVRRHLTPEGTVAVEFLHAPAVLRHASPIRVRRWPTPEGGTLLRISEVELDTARQTMHVDYELLDLDPAGTAVSRWTEAQDNRYFSVEEMRALFQGAGLATRFVPAYGESVTIDDQVWHVIAVARPA
jgi:SAM-dependent methyltransferase